MAASERESLGGDHGRYNISEIAPMIGGDSDEDAVKGEVTRPWRCIVALLGHAANIYVIILLGLAIQVLVVRSPEALVNNPLSRSRVATPLVWAGAALSLFAIVLMWSERLSRRRRALASDGHGDSAVIAMLVVLLPAVVFLLLFVTPAGACVAGAPSVAIAAADCFCDRVLATGTPTLGEEVPPGLTVAFVGDSDVVHQDQVLGLIQSEGASAVVFNGDTDFMQANEAWAERFQKRLGDTPFYVASSRKPDADTASRGTAERWAVNPWAAKCRGEVGVRTVCSHQGLGLMLKGIGSSCDSASEAPFFEHALSEFSESDVKWPICVFAFHSNQPEGARGQDESNPMWDNYNLCLQRGALIITSHSQPYFRTHEVDRLSTAAPHAHVSRHVDPGSSADEAAMLREGSSVLVVTDSGGSGGLGLSGAFAPGGTADAAGPRIETSGNDGIDVVPTGVGDDLAKETQARQAAYSPEAEKAAVEHQSAAASRHRGVFFCRFHVRGDPRLARCYFKDVSGHLADDFYVRRDVPSPDGRSHQIV